MFAASKFGCKLPAIKLLERDAELLSRVNEELRQYVDNMDHVKYVSLSVCLRLCGNCSTGGNNNQ